MQNADEIVLQSQNSQVAVDIAGAWITSCTIAGSPLLFPKQCVSGSDGGVKIRGGSHMCLPNFGPDAKSELPQHGFARQADWRVASLTKQSVILALEAIEPGYEGLTVRYEISVSENGLVQTLNIKNGGVVDMPIAPAFHPYFPLQAQKFKCAGIVYDKVDLYTPQEFESHGDVELECDAVKLSISADNLPHWVLWTDGLMDYVCVEPTQSGFSFSDDKKRDTLVTLAPGQNWSGSMTIRKEL